MIEGVTAALIFLASVLMVRRITRYAVLDVPNQRSLHTVPTPRGGGIAIALLTLVAVAGAMTASLASNRMFGWLAGALAITAISWIDDVRHVPALVRLLVHTAGAGCAIATFGAWTSIDLHPFGTLYLGAAGIPLTILWIVGLTNAWNFMDGIDGIAGLSAIIAAGFAVALLPSDGSVRFLAIPLAAATAGFLIRNWSPARIFMGDAGSAFIGYSLAVVPLIAGSQSGRSIWLGLLMVWPFVFDTSFTMLRRLRSRENVFAAHRSHMYQRLVIAGRTHAEVSLLYGMLAIVGGLSAVLVWHLDLLWIPVAVVTFSAALLWLVTTSLERRHAAVPHV